MDNVRKSQRQRGLRWLFERIAPHMMVCDAPTDSRLYYVNKFERLYLPFIKFYLFSFYGQLLGVYIFVFSGHGISKSHKFLFVSQ